MSFVSMSHPHSHWPTSARLPLTIVSLLCCLIVTGLVPSRVLAATTRTVNSNADDQSNGCSTAPGDCTLREAIAASLANDTVNFAASLNGAAIGLNGTEIGI